MQFYLERFLENRYNKENDLVYPYVERGGFMSGIRCQLCDGLIINGRCRTCGMPYRNDEILYHLNESSHDHYKHATPKAKELMRQSRVPLGDTGSYHKKSQNKNMWTGNTQSKNARSGSVQNRNTQSRSTHTGASAQVSDRLMSKEQIRAQQEKIRQEAMAKINTTKVQSKNTATKQSTKKKGIGGIWWILLAIYILFGAISKNL